MEKTTVIFRRYKPKHQIHAREIIALFPRLPEGNMEQYCTSYQHNGQHSPACYGGVIKITRPATPDEYDSLRLELESIGYVLRIRTHAQESARIKREGKLI